MFVGALEFFNSREDAVLLWLVLVSAFVLYKAPAAIASSALAVLRSFFAPKLLFGIWLPMTAYVGLILVFAHDLELWHTGSLKETVYWYATTGLVLRHRQRANGSRRIPEAGTSRAIHRPVGAIGRARPVPVLRGAPEHV